MENVAGEQGPPTTFSIFKSSYSFQISFLNGGGLKVSHFDIFDMLSPFLAFVKL